MKRAVPSFAFEEGKDELRKLQKSIQTIKAVLLDAEKKQESSAAVKDWVERVKDVLYDADDLFDEVANDEMLKQQMIKEDKLFKKVRASCSKLNPIVSRNSIANRVKDIRKRLLEISTDMTEFNFVTGRSEEPISGARQGRDPGSFVDSKDVVVRDEDKRVIFELLLDDKANQDVSVIAIVGIGGMGKTTLAQLVYSDEEVKKNFENMWFACISDTSNDKEVIGKVFQSICDKKYGDFTLSQLHAEIRESVKGVKFLLVLDDVWDDDHDRWIKQMSLLNGGAKGGKIIVTTRSQSVPTTVSKGAPDFCTVYTISKGKISTMRSASKPAPQMSPLREEIIKLQSNSVVACPPQALKSNERLSVTSNERLSAGTPSRAFDDMDYSGRSAVVKGGGRHQHLKSYGDIALLDSDLSFASSGRSSADFASYYDIDEPVGRAHQNRLSTSSDASSDYPFDIASRRSMDSFIDPDFPMMSDEASSMSWSSSYTEDVEAEMRRLRLEIKQTTDLYSGAHKEALLAKQKAMELKKWKLEEQRKTEEAMEKEKKEKENPEPQVVVEAAEASERIAEIESQKRLHIEIKALKEANEAENPMEIFSSDIRYRRYTIEEIEVATEYFAPSRKIGEGGYGPVFKARLDHTPVAIKVLRPDAAQGRSQFHQEIQVLSCIRHPHMVLLLGASPEYGCLVYEYMHNGSLEDRLFCKGGTPPIPWQHRFRIAAEIATGLLFLHQTKPEPLVHRDLKPANILLDRNLVSKISDVGLARLVPPKVADTVTQYRMTSTAGTFCYIDPEYQQTGMLGVKSDVYSLGILLLQIITAKSPMGLTHIVESALESESFEDILDPAVSDWPIAEAKSFAEMALKCAELRRKDRPDLGSVVL